MLGLDTDIRREKCDIFSAYANKSVKYWHLCALFFILFSLSLSTTFGKHHISYQRKKRFQPLLHRHIFSVFSRFHCHTDIFINGHYYSLQIPAVFVSIANNEKLLTHSFIFHFFTLCFTHFLSQFFLPGPENNLISCVL